MRFVLALAALAFAAPGGAQVQSRPTDPPLVTAASESWYQLREPLQFAGDTYYPAGAAVFFNGNTMVRAGHYNGVPLYVDATVEPYSVVLVPVSGGMMQPYERVRAGGLAGTTGSRAPSFPVRLAPEATMFPMAAIAPTSSPLTPGAIGAFTPAPLVAAPTGPLVEQTSVPSFGTPVVPAPTGPTSVSTLRRPENNDGVWIRYQEQKWVSAGPAVAYSDTWFTRVGQYAGFPVFKRKDLVDEVIYVPTRDEYVAPYRLKP